VVAFVSKGGNDVVGPKAQWPSFKNNNNPCWNTARDLGCHAMGPGAADSTLHLQIWSQEVGVLREYRSQIGEVCLPLRGIRPDEWYDEPVQITSARKVRGEVIPTLRFMIMSQPPLVKKVFFVRHAESEWNKAQRKKKVSAMLEQVDHPLSDNGLQQCFKLQQKIAAVQEAARELNENEAQFLDAQVTISSPLTRAIETALIGLHPILANAKSLRLCANAREKRNLGGRDTSGTAKGEAEIIHRLHTVLAQQRVQEADIDRYLSVRLDTTEADNRWWNDSRESASAVQERLAEFLRQMLYLREERIIVVGHSHFFRALIQQGLSLSANVVGVNRADLFLKKLMNCGVLAATLDFRKGADRPIAEVELLFDTVLE
jgi:broad specificity phosphatase PhoE